MLNTVNETQVKVYEGLKIINPCILQEKEEMRKELGRKMLWKG